MQAEQKADMLKAKYNNSTQSWRAGCNTAVVIVTETGNELQSDDAMSRNKFYNIWYVG